MRSFDFSRSTIPVVDTVTLQAVELGAPPTGSGQVAVVDVRIADGWNYYFEYRKGQVSQIGDQDLALGSDTNDAVVVGTDMISQRFTFPIARPQVMRLHKDAEMENSFFVVGEDCKETGSSSSMAVSDFKMSVLSISGDTARIGVQYGTNGRPDLYIGPWPAGNSYQSPDIIVENDRSIADPSQWANRPWVGHANTVKATYRNRGPITARNVRVDFFILDFTLGGAPKVLLGSDVHDVPPETSTPTVEFRTSWTPRDAGHKCIIAETPLYLDTSVSPTVVELTDSNSSAQSNYARYIAASASPAQRGILQVSLSNPFQARTEIFVMPQIRGRFARFYRLYLETSAAKLGPGETKSVQVMVESMFGDPEIEDTVKQYGKEFFVDTHMSLRGYGMPPEDPVRPMLLDGVQVDVGSGKATHFVDFVYLQGENQLRGQVVTLDGTRAVIGTVLLNFRAEPAERVETSVSAALTTEGRFTLGDVRQYAKKFDAKRVSAHYLGQPDLAPCDSKDEIRLF